MATGPAKVHFYGEQADFRRAIGAGKLACKFLIVSDRTGLHLCFGPLSRYPYHAGLLDRFCRERSVITQWVQRPDLLEVHGAEFEILGGGYLDVDPEERLVIVSGRSKAYGRVDRATMAKIFDGNPFFGDFSFTIA